MKFFLFAILIACSISSAYAQFIRDMDGKPFVQKSYVDVKGSPFLVDSWSDGTVKLDDGTTYKQNMQIKYDEVDDQLLFKDKNGDPLLFVKPVKEFSINYKDNGQTVSKYYRNGYKDIKGTTAATYFQVLSEGSVQLLKRVSKIIFETKAFNSANTDRNFVEVTKYYMIVGDKAIQVKKDKKPILNALPGNEQQIIEFVKANAIDFKSDTDLATLVTYYNSL